MNFFHTHISDKVYERVKSVLDSTYLSEGEIVEEFENALSEKLGLMKMKNSISCAPLVTGQSNAMMAYLC